MTGPQPIHPPGTLLRAIREDGSSVLFRVQQHLAEPVERGGLYTGMVVVHHVGANLLDSAGHYIHATADRVELAEPVPAVSAPEDDFGELVGDVYTPYPPGTTLGIRSPLYGLTYAEVIQHYPEPVERGGHYLARSKDLGIYLVEFGDDAEPDEAP